MQEQNDTTITDETAFFVTDAGLEALALTDECPDETGENDEPFMPDTADKADWLLGKIADARQRAARVRENAERIARQHEAEADGLLFRFGPALQDWTRKQTDGTRRRSVRLLNGQIGFRTKPTAFAIADEGEARAWAEANLPDALRVDKRTLTAIIGLSDEGKPVHADTGETLDFVSVTPSEETFYIK